MTRYSKFARALAPWLTAAIVAGTASGALAQEAADANDAADSPDPAFAVIEKMTDYVAGLDAYEFDTSILFDEPTLRGSSNKRAGVHHVAVKRPNKLFLDAKFDDGSERKIWFDGETITFANVGDETYIELPFDGDNDALVEAVESRLGIHLPTLLFVTSEPFDNVSENVVDAELKGTRTLGEETSTLVDIETIDAHSQMWIADGDAPLPKRLVITYIRENGDPEYIMTFDSFAKADLPDQAFVAEIPDGWQKVELNPTE